MFYHRRLLNHFMYINAWLTQHDARANLDMRSFRVEVTANVRRFVLFPQFGSENKKEDLGDGRDTGPNVAGFVGWLPYSNKRWPAAIDKMVFKRYISQHGKRTPQYWVDATTMPESVLIKSAKGSSGKGTRGPFKKINPEDETHLLREDEYYERFRQGKILRVWYWNDQPVCVELRDPLYVRGDGLRTVFELVKDTYKLEDKARRRYEARRQNLRDLLVYQNSDWEAVLSEGQSLQVDYVCGSSLYPDIWPNMNQLDAIRDSAVGKEISDCGPIFWNTISEHIRQNTLYSVDGIVGPHEEVRWLEMNCNPILPPDAYSLILDSVSKE